ncbi:hypothetical protein, partial [Pseudomonas poae]|uniref:hypothetical protein n=1 Tax=Pseudomonas poae TaxID=200451 RepID=UPI0034D59CE3
MENSELELEIVTQLSDILSDNPYSKSYRKASEMMTNEGNQNIVLRFVENISMDLRRFNKPTADEISGVFNSEEGEPPHNRYVV